MVVILAGIFQRHLFVQAARMTVCQVRIRRWNLSAHLKVKFSFRFLAD